jgi:hypothetical protein
VIVALWSAPRSRSTVFYRAMLERGDLLALHEPFCNLADFGETDVDDMTVRTGADLIAAMWSRAGDRTVFFKDTTDHRYDDVLADRTFLRAARHTFLIRRPAEIAASFAALKPDMTREEIGLELAYELYRAVVDSGGPAPVVVDADDLVAAPQAVLRAYCDAVGLPFVADSLHWTPVARDEWRRTDRWHQKVNESTGIVSTESTYARTVDNDTGLAAMAAHHEPFYQKLHAQRLIV